MDTALTLLDHDIYEICIHQASRQATVELFEHLTTILRTNEAHALADTSPAFSNRVLIVARPEPLPLVPMNSELMRWNKTYGHTRFRMAVLYEGSFMALTNVLMQKFNRRHMPMRLFKPSERAAALAWLREG